MYIGRLTVMFLAVALAGVLGQASAQPSMKFRGSGGWGEGTQYERLFDNYNLKTIMATVVRIDTATPMKDMTQAGLRLIVAPDGGKEIPVHLGPMWFALNQDLSFQKGVKLEIKGFHANYLGADFIMAVELRGKEKGKEWIFRFRDDDGNPLWCVFRPK